MSKASKQGSKQQPQVQHGTPLLVAVARTAADASMALAGALQAAADGQQPLLLSSTIHMRCGETAKP